MTDIEVLPRLGELAESHAAALTRLPGTSESDPFERLAAAFLLRYPVRTRTSYGSDLRIWAQWCADLGVHPLAAEPHHVDSWVQAQRVQATRLGRPTSPASLARRLSTLAAFYRHGVTLGVLTRSPVDGVRRPRVADESSTSGLTLDELKALLHTADQHGPRSGAVVGLLILTGVRVSEALNADVSDITIDQGHRVLRITRKGGKPGKVVLPTPALQRIEAYLDGRTDGPLFTVGAGSDRYSRQPFARQLVRLAKASGIESPERIHPHSLRHSFATRAFELRVPLQDVQDALGHADSRTTRRYDRSQNHLGRSPGYQVAQDFA